MSVRLVIITHAKPGKGTELAQAMADQAALDAHARLNATRPPNPALAALRADGVRPREDYVYNRTR